MRAPRLLFAFLAAALLQGQAVVNVSPSQPKVGIPATFTLTGLVPASVDWSFGDGSPTQSGGSVTTNTYSYPGSFIVRATYRTSPAGPSTTVQRAVMVLGASAIRFSPAAPSPGQEILFQAPATSGTSVQWSWGDDTPSVTSTNGQAVHTYARPGLYRAMAQNATGGPALRVQVAVGGSGPSAPFSLSYLALRWEDGRVRRTVTLGNTELAAFADLRFEGTGLLQAQWLVDGVPFRTFSRQLTFAHRLTLSSGVGAAGGLPTNIPGEHTVTLKVLQPALAFEIPVIRYFVSLGPDAEGPELKSVTPRRARAGEEVELQLAGPRLREDMELHLGRDFAVVGPLRITGPETATVLVFVAPTARPGTRILRASRDKGAPAGTARLDILPPLKRQAARK